MEKRSTRLPCGTCAPAAAHLNGSALEAPASLPWGGQGKPGVGSDLDLLLIDADARGPQQRRLPPLVVGAGGPVQGAWGCEVPVSGGHGTQGAPPSILQRNGKRGV